MAAESNNLVAPNDGGGSDRPSAEDRRKDLKQSVGVSTVKQKDEGAVLNWLRKMFFSGKSVKQILLDVAENNAVPWVKDGLYNMVTCLAAQLIYRDHKSVPTTGGTVSQNGSFVTNYVKYADKKKQESTLQENQKKDEEAIKAGFEYPAFKNDPPGTKNGQTALQKARTFLGEMHEYVRKYHTMSVEDLMWKCGKTVNYAWDKYGWNEEEILAIREPTHINNAETPYIIMLPKAHEMNYE